MERIKSLAHNKKFVMMMFFAVVCISATFAETDTFGLNSKVKILIDLISSPWVKGIAFIALVIECIGLITAGRQEPGMFKKFIPWIAGTIIFMAAGTITNKFLNLDNSTFNSVMGSTTDLNQPHKIGHPRRCKKYG